MQVLVDKLSGWEVEAGMMIRAAETGVSEGRTAAGRLMIMKTRVEHKSTEAMIRIERKTWRVKIFFILVRFAKPIPDNLGHQDQ
jgi:hypothetical protein